MYLFSYQPLPLWHIYCLLSGTLLLACICLWNIQSSSLTPKEGSHQKEVHAFIHNSWYLIYIPTTKVQYSAPQPCLWLHYNDDLKMVNLSYSRLASIITFKSTILAFLFLHIWYLSPLTPSYKVKSWVSVFMEG